MALLVVQLTAALSLLPALFAPRPGFARFGRVEAYLWAVFGRARPTPAQLASANAEPPDGQAPQVRSPEIVIEIRAEKSPCKRPAEITKVS